MLVRARALLLLLACVGGGGAGRTCVARHALDTADAFGVSVVSIPTGPSVTALSKRVCVTESPAVWIRYRGERMNLLNITSSQAQCHATYAAFVCPAPRAPAAGVDCYHANVIAFAAMQRVPPCRSEADCQRAPTETALSLIYCPWAAEMRAAVCPGAAVAACSPDHTESFAIDGDQACALTNSVCSGLVHNTILVASLAGATYFVVIFGVICCCVHCSDDRARAPDVLVYTERARALPAPPGPPPWY